ncbi:adenine phosphoribosyltransferase [Anopheles sinensis]|uniref:Adenine phosphoribosyltransferase n=1 Tax=Anopheles sinensis TaxID=74873 RepID=A0A084VE92_ANOSI|nr:adenine phosphoribosyltransferase [Anopheles sinensis]
MHFITSPHTRQLHRPKTDRTWDLAGSAATLPNIQNYSASAGKNSTSLGVFRARTRGNDAEQNENIRNSVESGWRRVESATTTANSLQPSNSEFNPISPPRASGGELVRNPCCDAPDDDPHPSPEGCLVLQWPTAPVEASHTNMGPREIDDLVKEIGPTSGGAGYGHLLPELSCLDTNGNRLQHHERFGGWRAAFFHMCVPGVYRIPPGVRPSHPF